MPLRVPSFVPSPRSLRSIFIVGAVLCGGLALTTMFSGLVVFAASNPALAPVIAKNIDASAWAPDAQKPVNAIDGDPQTRWSAEGNEQWLRLDLGEAHQISAVEIAFPQGARRNELFILQLSSHGETWTEVFGGQSSGKSADFERFTFAPQRARFVRYLGFGNSENAWNNLAEIRVLAPAP